jgi:hypothetical protein
MELFENIYQFIKPFIIVYIVEELVVMHKIYLDVFLKVLNNL